VLSHLRRPQTRHSVASRQVDVVELLDRGSADGTLAAALTGRTDLPDAIPAKADVTARLKNDLARIRETHGAPIPGRLVVLGPAKLVPKAEVLLVGLLGRLVEEERREGGHHEAEELEDPSEDVSGTPGLSGGSGRGRSGRGVCRDSAHLL